jgi:hypothetical protein
VSEPFVQPCSHMPIPGGSVTLCGPTLTIDIGNRVIPFEMHRYFGPTPLTQKGEEMLRVPKAFWNAIDKWCENGQLVDGDVCLTQK